jgi:hypothetical protein
MFEQLDQNPDWAPAVRTATGTITGRVTNEVLNIRAEPNLESRIVDSTYARHTLQIYDVVTGDPVIENNRWYRVETGQHVTASFVEPFVAPAFDEVYEGRWLGVNLTGFYDVAYEWVVPRYGAIITSGRGDRISKGVFEALYRARNVTMDSATVGILEGHPEHYRLENVEYTEYFKYAGYAVHGNYWTDPPNFGQFSSNCCVGLMNAGAAWFWEFLDVWSIISVHF